MLKRRKSLVVLPDTPALTAPHLAATAALDIALDTVLDTAAPHPAQAVLTSALS